jgi:hypothetical protein
MKDNSNRVVTLVLLGWLCFAVGLAGWFQNASALTVAATVLDIDRACPSRVLESQDNQSVCIEYRSSLAGGTSPDTVICWRVLSGALSAPRFALRFRNTGGLGRHRYWCPGGAFG